MESHPFLFRQLFLHSNTPIKACSEWIVLIACLKQQNKRRDNHDELGVVSSRFGRYLLSYPLLTSAF